MDLMSLKTFVAVVQAGSFASAARATRMPKSTLSKRFQDLESSLGLRLLQRTTRRLHMTADGELLFERARRLIADANDLERLMRDRDKVPRGRLRISVPVLFGNALMGRIAAAYSRRWPETTIEVACTDRRADLVEEDFDCAIRVGPLEDSLLVARTFAQSRNILVVAPDLLKRKLLRHPSHLARWPTISFMPASVQLPWRLESGEEKLELRPESAISLGSLYAVRDAARTSAGVAFVPEFVVADDLHAGSLKHVLPAWSGPVADLYIVYPTRRHLSPRVQAFIDVVMAAFPKRTLVGAAVG